MGWESSAHARINAINPLKPAAATGLIKGALEGEDEDGDDDGDGDRVIDDLKSGGQPASGKKKKNKKSNKKKKKVVTIQQTTPPRVALATLFPNQPYPPGEIIEFVPKDANLRRTTAEELRHLSTVENMDNGFLHDYRQAAEVHRQVRQHVQTIAKPGLSMSQLAQEIEDGVRALVDHQGIETGDALKAGMGFPTGLCLNNIAAHWTPNPGGKE
ncbi:MAG: hypothetical protein Q9210_007158, partial [Variospora velana]